MRSFVVRHTRRGAPQRSVASATHDGFTLIELTCAMMILAIVSVGFAATLALGMRTVAMARQRQTAADLGSARIEHVRGVPYDRIALGSQPTHNTDSTNPDWFVSADGSSFNIDGKGTTEPLVVDVANGDLLHFEDPVQVGATVLRIYQYVTWVDDAAISGTQNYKRVTTIVQYKAPSITGLSRIVRSSALFSVGQVTISAATTTLPSATTTIPSTTTTMPATTTTAGLCPADSSAPTGSFSLSANTGSQTGYTATNSIGVTTALSDPCAPIQFRLTNDGSTWGSWVTFDSLNPSVSWPLAPGDGTKTVSLQSRDGKGNTGTFSAATIVLDTTHPSTPASLTRTVTCGGTNRTVNLAWGISTDLNFAGYRIYRSTDATTWSALATSSSTSFNDTHKKNLDSVRYYIVGYDRAGNESTATVLVSLSKNHCS